MYDIIKRLDAIIAIGDRGLFCWVPNQYYSRGLCRARSVRVQLEEMLFEYLIKDSLKACVVFGVRRVSRTQPEIGYVLLAVFGVPLDYEVYMTFVETHGVCIE